MFTSVAGDGVPAGIASPVDLCCVWQTWCDGGYKEAGIKEATEGTAEGEGAAHAGKEGEMKEPLLCIHWRERQHKSEL